MGNASPLNPYTGPDVLVDQMVGNAYRSVKRVSDNIDAIRWMAENSVALQDNFKATNETASIMTKKFAEFGDLSAGVASVSVDRAKAEAAASQAQINAENASLAASLSGSPDVVAVAEDLLSFKATGANSVPRRLKDKIAETVTPEDYGAVGDGVTNDRVAIQAAINATALKGGGLVRLTRRYVVSGADLIVKDGVSLSGSLVAGGQMQGADYSGLCPVILLDPTYHIRLFRHAVLSGLAVLRLGMPGKPTTLRDCYTIQNSMRGTAIVVGDAINVAPSHFGSSWLTGTNANIGADAQIVDVLVLGFDLAVYSDYNNRTLFKNLLMDCRNGVVMRRGYDSCRIENLRSWPFLTGNTIAAKGDFTLTGVAQGSSASYTRLTTSAASVLQVGDEFNIFGVTNFPTLNGRRVITAVDATNGWVDVAVAYAPTSTVVLTSAGITVWGNRRKGTMLKVERIDGLSVMGAYAYGMDRGFFAGDEMNWLELHSAAVDDWISLQDPDCVGYEFDGSVNQCSIYGISSSSQAVALKYNSTMNAHLPIFGGLLGATALNVTGGSKKGIQIRGGSVGLYGVVGDGITAHLSSGTMGLMQFGGGLSTVTADDGIVAARYMKVNVAGDPGVRDFYAKELSFGTHLMNGTKFEKFKLNEDGTQKFGPRTSGSGTQLQLTRGTDKAVAAIISLGSGNNPQITIAGEGTNNPNAPVQFGGNGTSVNAQYVYTMRYDAAIQPNTQVGSYNFLGTNSGAAASIQYARITAVAQAVTPNAEKGQLDFVVRSGTGEKLALRVTDSRVQAGAPVQLPSYAVADLPSALDYGTPAIAHCTNGAAGNPCLVIATAGIWRQVAIGSPVSAS